MPRAGRLGAGRRVWRNWSGEQACRPAVVELPRSTPDVAAAIRRARARRHVLRVTGAAHSFNDAVVTDGALMSLDAMDRILDVDAASGLVRVQAGIRLRALADGLARHGLALESLGDVDVQSLAGAISTGTHGAGATLGNLSSQVAGVTLVDGTGEVRSPTGGEELRAARVALGALGVVTEVTLRCVPAYVLRGTDAREPLADVLGSLEQRAAAARHFEFFVFPHTDVALTRTNTVEDGPAAPPSRAARWASDVLLTNYAFGALCAVGRRMPEVIPQLNRLAASVAGERVRIDRSDRIFATPRRVRFVETELAVPARHARAAVEEVLDAARRFPVGFPIEVRPVAADDALISPAAGRPTVTISVHTARGMPWEGLFRAVHAIGERYDARPHWGKRHFHTAPTLAPRYPGWAAFAAVRRRLDPDGRFANAHVRRVLG